MTVICAPLPPLSSLLVAMHDPEQTSVSSNINLLFFSFLFILRLFPDTLVIWKPIRLFLDRPPPRVNLLIHCSPVRHCRHREIDLSPVMAPAFPSAQIEVDYPVYAVDFDHQDANKLVIGGGGGAGMSGVGNKIVSFHACCNPPDMYHSNVNILKGD